MRSGMRLCGDAGPCGQGAMPTFETPTVPQRSSTNKPGPSPTIAPTEPVPDGPPTPIKKRSGPPPDGSSRFERQPQGSLGAAANVDLTEAAVEPVESPRRLFRQSASAGFQTHVRRALEVSSSRKYDPRRGREVPLATSSCPALARTD